MVRINENYTRLKSSYLFSEIARRVREFASANPDADLIRLGIGDVTRPLPEAVRRAMHLAVDEMGEAASFRGYGPEWGYDFLREAISAGDYASRGIQIEPDEIVVSDGSKCDAANIQEIFSTDASVALLDPVYPVYVDSNVMAGRSGDAGPDGRYKNFIYLPCTAENRFQPSLPDRRADLVYLCYPNNPTGSVLTRPELAVWVDWARANGSILLFDAAYEAYIRDPAIPHSIYEIEGARDCAIEMRSFSKNAGFTGTRCAFTVVPRELRGATASGEPLSIRDLWMRRQSTRFNGVPYVVQRGAEAVYTPEGQQQVAALVDDYMENARLIREGLAEAGYEIYGGENAPYIWLRTPGGMGSWEFFDRLLHQAHVVGTPGSGFGPSGEGYFRLTAFGGREQTREALRRIRDRMPGAVS